MTLELNEHIRQLTEELRIVREEINSVARGDPAEAVRPYPLSQVLEPIVIKEFRSAVDQTRLLLWAHLETAGTKSGISAEQILQSARMERVTEMLRKMREELPISQMVKMPEACNMLQEIGQVASDAADRHSTS